MKRKHAFDVLKIFFIYVIVVHHSHILDGLMIRGYIPVEFFFITSGYFLVISVTNAKYTRKEWIKSRVLRLFPLYWFSNILLLMLFCVYNWELPYKTWYAPIMEILLLQNVGLPGAGALNYPCWYLSVLFYGSIITYFLLKKLPQKLYIGISISIILGVYFLFMYQSPMIEQWGYVGNIIYLPFLRGLVDIMIGTVCVYIPFLPRNFARVMEVISFLTILFLIFLPGNWDYIAVFCIIVLVLSIRGEFAISNSIGDIPFLRALTKYEYGIFLMHALIINIINKCLFFEKLHWSLRLILIILMTTLVSVCTTEMIQWIIKKINVRTNSLTARR